MLDLQFCSRENTLPADYHNQSNRFFTHLACLDPTGLRRCQGLCPPLTISGIVITNFIAFCRAVVVAARREKFCHRQTSYPAYTRTGSWLDL